MGEFLIGDRFASGVDDRSDDDEYAGLYLLSRR